MRRKDLPKIKCPVCGSEFKPRNYNQKFCSDPCRDENHNAFVNAAVEFYRKHLVETGQR